jgi:hypothetical protein
VAVERWVLKVNEAAPTWWNLHQEQAIDPCGEHPLSASDGVTTPKEIRQTTLLYGVPYTTTVSGAAGNGPAIRESGDTGLACAACRTTTAFKFPARQRQGRAAGASAEDGSPGAPGVVPGPDPTIKDRQ